MCGNITEAEQESEEEKWEGMVVTLKTASYNVVGRSGAKGRRNRDTCWRKYKRHSGIRKMPLQPGQGMVTENVEKYTKNV